MTTPTERILLVDDDPDLLEALSRQHRKHFELVEACGPGEGLKKLAEDGSFAVVVSDYHMPRMDGVTFLKEARALAPEMVRVMLTGQAELHTAIEAVNKGAIFRFLTKPCDAEIFRSCLDAALEQHRLRHAERVLLEHTVKGSIEVLADVLALANPPAFGRATRIRNYVRHIVTALKLPDRWQYETAALLSQIGCVAIPNDLFERLADGDSLTPEQAAMMDRHPEIARDLLRKIPRLHTVAQIVYHQGQRQAGRPRDANASVELGGRILAAALDFEELLSLGATHKQALDALRKDGRKHHPKVLDALASAQVVATDSAVRLVPLRQAQAGMVLEENVRSKDGQLIVARGHELTNSSLVRLKNYKDLDLLAKKELRVRLAPSNGEGSSTRAA